MIYSQLGSFISPFKRLPKTSTLISILVLLENLHAVGHFKDEFPTCLNFARNLGNSVYESIKRITNWAAYYFTHPTSYYPVSETTIALKEISRLPHLGKTRRLNSNEQQMRREWAVQHGESVRQRTVKQEGQ